MLNQVVLVVHLTSDIEIQKTESRKRRTLLTLAVPRTYKNVDGWIWLLQRYNIITKSKKRI